jgi:cytochrome c
MIRLSTCRSARLIITSLVITTISSGEQKRTGNDLFQNRCGGCHSADHDRVGPRLRGVFGRTSGAIHTFRYSEALKSSHLVWDAATLDKWLQDPDSVVPDNDMSFRLESQAERTAIIEYLKGLTAH